MCCVLEGSNTTHQSGVSFWSRTLPSHFYLSLKNIYNRTILYVFVLCTSAWKNRAFPNLYDSPVPRSRRTQTHRDATPIVSRSPGHKVCIFQKKSRTDQIKGRTIYIKCPDCYLNTSFKLVEMEQRYDQENGPVAIVILAAEFSHCGSNGGRDKIFGAV